MRLSAAIEHVQKIRKQCALASRLAAGLEEMQSEMDSRKMQRLNDRLRNSTVLSLGLNRCRLVALRVPSRYAARV